LEERGIHIFWVEQYAKEDTSLMKVAIGDLSCFLFGLFFHLDDGPSRYQFTFCKLHGIITQETELFVLYSRL
jgi:hypothetical protein